MSSDPGVLFISGPEPAAASAQNGKAATAEPGPANADGADEAEAGTAADADPRQLIAQSYIPQDPGPYPQDKPPENAVRFTPVQVIIRI